MSMIDKQKDVSYLKLSKVDLPNLVSSLKWTPTMTFISNVTPFTNINNGHFLINKKTLHHVMPTQSK